VWLEDAVLGELTQALARGIDPEFADDRGRPVVLVCMAGVDHLVARPFVERGDATIAQAALRWLADARWAERPADGSIDAPATGSAADRVGRYPPRRPGGGPLSSSTSAK